MSGANVELDELDYPSSDGKPMAETSVHLLLMIALISALRHHFQNHSDVYVIGNMFLYYQQGNVAARRAPDIMVIKGVDASLPRRSFKTWVEGVVPAVVVELTSKQTVREDQKTKLRLYQKLRIREYFLFDPLHDYLPRQLMGYCLVNGRYQELTPNEDGALVSVELGLRLVPEGTDLIMVDIKTGKRLLGPDELLAITKELEQQGAESREELQRMEQAVKAAKQQADKQKKRADKEKERADLQKQIAEQERQHAEQGRRIAEQEKHRAEQEKQIAEQEKHRADALAAEVARLRAQLKRPSG